MVTGRLKPQPFNVLLVQWHSISLHHSSRTRSPHWKKNGGTTLPRISPQFKHWFAVLHCSLERTIKSLREQVDEKSQLVKGMKLELDTIKRAASKAHRCTCVVQFHNSHWHLHCTYTVSRKYVPLLFFE